MPIPDRDISSVADLLARATEITPLESVGKSGSRLDQVLIDGQRYVVKYVDTHDDWILRAAGVDAPSELWRRGIFDLLPECINQPIVAVAHDDAGTALLMQDVGDWLVPVSDQPITLDQHRRFLDHMAILHATFWESDLDIDVVSLRARYLELSPHTSRREASLGSTHPVPDLIGRGWPLLEEVAPTAAAIVAPLAIDPTPLLNGLSGSPHTFVHGDWKLDNLGTDPSGRTILLDWAMPGRAPALCDLAWYLAINCRRLPETKDKSIDAYREALERQGISTDAWWSRQLSLCLLGGLVLFGWDKAFGGYDDELIWWEQRAVEAVDLL